MPHNASSNRKIISSSLPLCQVCKISLSFRFRISLSDMTNYKSAFGKVCRIKNQHTLKVCRFLIRHTLPNADVISSYHAVKYAELRIGILLKYAELRIGILLKVCRFLIRHTMR